MSKNAVEMQEIGTYYKQVREERGYTLSDVAMSSDYLDKSQLSRFESGENMLSADRFLAAIVVLQNNKWREKFSQRR